MNPATIVNAAANVIIAIAVVDMAIRVFGNRKHRIHAHRELFWIRKVISSMVICGAVLNVVTLSTPSWSETLLNLAFAANYCFSSFYDRIASSSNSKVAADVPRRRTPGRPSDSRKTPSRSSSSRSGRKRPSTR